MVGMQTSHGSRLNAIHVLSLLEVFFVVRPPFDNLAVVVGSLIMADLTTRMSMRVLCMRNVFFFLYKYIFVRRSKMAIFTKWMFAAWSVHVWIYWTMNILWLIPKIEEKSKRVYFHQPFSFTKQMSAFFFVNMYVHHIPIWPFLIMNQKGWLCNQYLG